MSNFAIHHQESMSQATGVGAAIAALFVKAPETVGITLGTTLPEISVGVPKLQALSRLKM